MVRPSCPRNAYSLGCSMGMEPTEFGPVPRKCARIKSWHGRKRHLVPLPWLTAEHGRCQALCDSVTRVSDVKRLHPGVHSVEPGEGRATEWPDCFKRTSPSWFICSLLVAPEATLSSLSRG